MTRLFRRIRIAPGLRVNLSKSGASVSIGRRGAWYTMGPRGQRMTVGAPGTGLFWTEHSRATRAVACSGAGRPRHSGVLGGVRAHRLGDCHARLGRRGKVSAHGKRASWSRSANRACAPERRPAANASITFILHLHSWREAQLTNPFLPPRQP